MPGSALAFALASSLHAGFQLTVTTLVYPSLAARRPEEWAEAHDRHTRVITPVVGAVYAPLVVTGVRAIARRSDAASAVGLVGAAAALAVTATLAGPLHGRLAAHDPDLVARLLVLDRWRCAAAVVGAAGAVIAARRLDG